MPGLLKNTPVTDAERRQNDQHRPLVVVAVLLVLGVYLYLFTYIADPLGIPRPQDLAQQMGIQVEHVFDSDRNVESNLGISMTQRYETNDEERLVYFVILIFAFLSAYFLPLRLKQPSLVFWSLVTIWMLYGREATATLLIAHFFVYLILHPNRGFNLALSAFTGVIAYWGFVSCSQSLLFCIAAAILMPLLAVGIYLYGLLPLLRYRRLATVLHKLTIHSAIVAIGLGVLWQSFNGSTWALPLGLLMLFWQWARLVMYYIDYRDGLIPEDVSIGQYLAVFMNPGSIPSWSWGVTIAQGYAYVHNNFLCEDKNKLVLSGLRLLGIALLYLVFWDWLRVFATDFFAGLGIPVYETYTRQMVRLFVSGAEISTASVLVTTLLDLVRFMMFFGSVVHFKVGIWRICGYRVAPYYNYPWLATNLASFWARFAYHYREFLVRAFYYPVFFRYFKEYPALRLLAASMAAAAIGNIIWHMTERVFFRSIKLDEIVYVLGTWPYFVLLGGGIGLCQLYLMGRKRSRRAWTLDRWIAGDVLATYCTLQYFALIRIFTRPVSDSSTWDLFRLFTTGFGLDIAK